MAKRTRDIASRSLDPRSKTTLQGSEGSAKPTHAGLTALQKAAPQRPVASSIQRLTHRVPSIATCPASLLIVRFEGRRQLKVSDPPDVRAIDAHPERVGSHDDPAPPLHERLEDAAALRTRQAGVVRLCPVPSARQTISCRLHRAPRGSVHDRRPGFGRQSGMNGLHTLLERSAPGDSPPQVRAIEGVDYGGRVGQPKALHYVPAYRRGRTGGQGQNGASETTLEMPQATVRRTEVVAPLRDAVCLIDRDEPDDSSPDPVEKGLQSRSLRCHEEQTLSSVRDRTLCPPAVLRRLGRGQAPGGNPGLTGPSDLILHQGNQRRDDERQPSQRQGGNLIADALAAPGREHTQGIPTGEYRSHEVLLTRAEAGKAEVVPEERKRGDGHARTIIGIVRPGDSKRGHRSER